MTLLKCFLCRKETEGGRMEMEKLFLVHSKNPSAEREKSYEHFCTSTTFFSVRCIYRAASLLLAFTVNLKTTKKNEKQNLLAYSIKCISRGLNASSYQH